MPSSCCTQRFVVGLFLIAVVQLLLCHPAQCSSTLMKYLASEYNLSQVSYYYYYIIPVNFASDFIFWLNSYFEILI